MLIILTLVTMIAIPASALDTAENAEKKISESGEEYFLVQESDPRMRATGDYCSASGISSRWIDNGNTNLAEGYTNVRNKSGKQIRHYSNVRWKGMVMHSESGRVWGEGNVWASAKVSFYSWSRDWLISRYVYWGS